MVQLDCRPEPRACSALLLLCAAVILLFSASCANAQAYDYELRDAFGPSSVYAGSNAYVQFNPVVTLGGVTAIPLYFSAAQLSGSPLAFSVVCRSFDCPIRNGLYYENIYAGSGYQVIVKVTIPRSTPAGQYSLAIVTTAGTITRTLTVPLRVQSPPAAPSASPFLSSLTIPGLSKWQSTMLSLGRKWCDASAVYSFSTEGQVWYYDGARVFYEIADYTGDPIWNACALNIARQYRDYVIGAQGGIPAWRVFTRGLRLAYERTGDVSFKQAIVALAGKGYVKYQLAVSDAVIRENAYALNTLVDAELAGEPRSPHLVRLADYLIGHYDQIFVAKHYTVHQTFYDGLAAEALIHYYELTHDPRVPPTIKLMLDWLWDYGWHKSTFRMVYNPDPPGPTCSEGCQSYSATLVNLVVPAYGWYWRTTGDIAYQQRGDELFSHALDEDISWNGKIFSQNYHWSFDYVRWRSVEPACTYDVSAPASQMSSSGGSINISVGAAASCSWTASSNSSWAVPSTAGSITGPGSVVFTFSPNTSSTARIAALKIANQSFTVTQAGAPQYTLASIHLASTVVRSAATLTSNQVSLTAPAQQQTVVSLLSSNPAAASVPASVTVAAGASAAAFAISTGSVAASTSVTITASYGGVSRSSSITVNPPKLSALSFGASAITGGLPVTVYIGLDAPAPSGGISIALASANPAVAAPPPSVTLPAGAKTATCSMATYNVAAATPVSITASHGGVVVSASIEVRPVTIAAINLQQTSIKAGTSLAWSFVSLTGPAPAGGLIVSLSSSNAAITVPASITVPAGSRTGAFLITAAPVTAPMAVTIYAQQGGKTIPATISVTP